MESQGIAQHYSQIEKIEQRREFGELAGSQRANAANSTQKTITLSDKKTESFSIY